MDRKTQKRERNHTTPQPQPQEKKRHSMEILQEAINQTITDLFDIMDVFEYDDSVSIAFDVFPPFRTFYIFYLL